jgi:hypothetical protein
LQQWFLEFLESLQESVAGFIARVADQQPLSHESSAVSLRTPDSEQNGWLVLNLLGDPQMEII